MATKAKKTTGKKSSTSVRDLAARNDPKGGAQKKETNSMKRAGSPLRPGGRNLS